MAASLISLIGCSGSGEETQTAETLPPETETEAAAEPETTILDTLPAEDLGGMTFRILGVSYPTRRNFPTDEEAGEAVNEALAGRDTKVSEMLNIMIETQAEEKADTITKIVKDTVIAGDDVCDMVITDITKDCDELFCNGKAPFSDQWFCGYYHFIRFSRAFPSFFVFLFHRTHVK
ncbi:MAG: hypothetical protein IJX14_02490 [Clostridia bacterium]|nr:hypothetical protein [Clostridia bacterium]